MRGYIYEPLDTKMINIEEKGQTISSNGDLKKRQNYLNFWKYYAALSYFIHLEDCHELFGSWECHLFQPQTTKGKDRGGGGGTKGQDNVQCNEVHRSIYD